MIFVQHLDIMGTVHTAQYTQRHFSGSLLLVVCLRLVDIMLGKGTHPQRACG